MIARKSSRFVDKPRSLLFYWGTLSGSIVLTTFPYPKILDLDENTSRIQTQAYVAKSSDE
jgi:hypothetical protein